MKAVKNSYSNCFFAIVISMLICIILIQEYSIQFSSLQFFYLTFIDYRYRELMIDYVKMASEGQKIN